MTALRWFFFLWCCGYLLCAGCAHRFRSHQTANRVEQETRTFQTAASAVEKQQSVETKKTATKRVVEKFRPDGTLLERMTEQHDSDGKVVTVADSASRSTAEGGQSRSVASSRSSSKQTSTSWWPPWWLWLMGGLALLGGGWYLKRRYL